MKTRTLTLACLLSVAATTSFAADLPSKRIQRPLPPETIAAVDWTGFYAGVHAGGAWGRTTATDRNPIFGNAGAGDGFSAGTSGFLGGVQAGYNWQRGPLVAGVEGDLGYLGLQGSQMRDLALLAPTPPTSSIALPPGCNSSTAPGCAPIVVTQPGSQTFSPTRLRTDGGPYATLRGRLGVTAGNFLFFATGGLFAADLNSHLTSQDGLLVTGKTGWGLGWTAGGGVEVAMSEKLRLKLDYLHFEMGTQRVTGAVNGVARPFDIKQKGDLVRVGLNYRF